MTIEQLITLSLEEDLGNGDITTESLELERRQSQAFLIAKAPGVLAGIDVFYQTFRQVDPSISIVFYKKDGDRVQPKDEIARLEGNPASMLKAERVALNFLQRLSGVASYTRLLVDAIGENRARLLDTRKTTPMLRQLEKYAVRVGGGFNHRIGLYDMILLKENHIRAAGSITQAVRKVKQRNTSYKIEVEVTNLEELAEAVRSKVDRVMLDNMSIEMMRTAVEQYHGQVELEASGNVSLETITGIAETGVDFISCGAITHSYKSLDLSLLFKE